MKKIISLVAILLVCGSTTGLHAQSDSVEVLKVVQRLFDSIEAQDTVAFRALFAPEAQKFIAVVRNGEVVRTMGGSATERAPYSPGDKMIETMRGIGVEVEVHGSMAMAWVPYDFTINGQLSHCGVDVCTLVKVGDEWKFALIAYTVEYDQCGDW